MGFITSIVLSLTTDGLLLSIQRMKDLIFDIDKMSKINTEKISRPMIEPTDIFDTMKYRKSSFLFLVFDQINIFVALLIK